MKTAWKNRQTVYRLAPCPPYDVEGTESWLADMAAKGLHLKEDGIFAGVAAFEKGTPKHVAYRLDASMKDTSMFGENLGAPDSETIEISRIYGWEYVAVRGQFHIYRAENAVRERNTDPVVQALALKEVQKRQRSSLFNLLFWLLIYPMAYRMDNGMILTVVWIGTWYFLFTTLIIGLMVGGSIAELVHLRKLRRKLLNGQPFQHHKEWQKNALRHHVVRGMEILLVAVWIGMMVHLLGMAISEEYEVPLDEYEGNPPFATMVDLAEGMWREENGAAGGKADGSDVSVSAYRFSLLGIANTVYEWSDPVAPVNFNWDEVAEVTLSDGRRIEGSLYVDYHETAHPALARQLAREYQWREKYDHWMANLFSKDEDEYEELEVDWTAAAKSAGVGGFDFAVAFYNEMHIPTVILQKGNKVIHAAFHQYQSADQIPQEVWIGMMAESVK